MDIFNVLTMIGGLSLFLFGMNIMGQALERSAGDRLRGVLQKMTGRKLAGFLTGLGVTAIIQSSSATTVMVVGFVNSGLLTLKQAINVIMGANVGTTVTAWILSLSGLSGSSLLVRLLKPSSFTPVLALIGVVLYMFCKTSRKKDIGTVLLGFATLMFGMETMTGAVSGLKDLPGFQNLFLLFTQPILGVLAGALLTAVIQSSSASVGILQALAATGAVSYGAAIPIIMGQNIGTCVTALISSVGATRNAKRAAGVHLLFNVLGTAVCLALFYLVRGVFSPAFLGMEASMAGIAVAHSVFNIFCTLLLLPATGLLERLVTRIVPDDAGTETPTALDERLLATPALALEQSRQRATQMAGDAAGALRLALRQLTAYRPEEAEKIRAAETRTDHDEDMLGTYLLKLSAGSVLTDRDSEEVTVLLKLIGDFERLGDHAVNILESAEEIKEKELGFSQAACAELAVLRAAVEEVLELALHAFSADDVQLALRVEPLEQVIDELKEQLRTNHILRMTKGACSIEAGFVWSDLLTNMERVSDHCSNIAGAILDAQGHNMSMHETIHSSVKTSSTFSETYTRFRTKYAI